MSSPKMTIIFISEVSRRKPRLEPNDILNKVLVRNAETGIYCRAGPTTTSLLVF